MITMKNNNINYKKQKIQKIYLYSKNKLKNKKKKNYLII